MEGRQRDQIALDLADALAAVAPSPARRALAVDDWRSVKIARELLDADVTSEVTSLDLEAATGVNRFTLARHFRACLGTSPYRYLVMRRLDRARSLTRNGAPLADAAFCCGFADQSHMRRHFKQTYGLTPSRWAAITVGATIGPTRAGPPRS